MSEAKNPKSKYIECPMCNAITLPTAYGVCKSCYQEDQRLFEAAKSVIGFNELVTAEIISQRSGVNQQTIRRWVDQGRLKLNSSR